MAASIDTIYRMIDEIAPFFDAYSWDNSGLLIRVCEETQNILVALDLTDDVIDQAMQNNCGLIITHHPIFFDALKKIDIRTTEQSRVIRMIQNGISLISAHTNMDKAQGGINDYLAKKLGLQKVRILAEEYDAYVKIAVFVPNAFTHQVIKAGCEAGAGNIGDYSQCSFGAQGTGTFVPNNGAQPFVGIAGELHHEAETRLEMICPGKLSGKVVDAIKNVHPYEVPAIDIYALKEPKSEKGTARMGLLEREYSKDEFVSFVKNTFGFEMLRVSASNKKIVKSVAVCGGGGASLLSLVKKNGADAYLTGEIKHSDYIGRGLNDALLIEAGHFDTERCFIELIFEGLQPRLNALECNVHVMKANMKKPYDCV